MTVSTGIETQEPEYAENLLKFVCNIQSLSDLSMKVINFREGYLLIFSFNKNKEFKDEIIKNC